MTARRQDRWGVGQSGQGRFLPVHGDHDEEVAVHGLLHLGDDGHLEGIEGDLDDGGAHDRFLMRELVSFEEVDHISPPTL